MADATHLTLVTKPVAPVESTELLGVLWEHDGVHTNVNMVSTHFTRAKQVKFQAEFILHDRGAKEPFCRFVTPEFSYGQNMRVLMKEALELVGRENALGIYFVRMWPTAHRELARGQNDLEPWCDYQSDDGKVYVTVPSSHYKGGRFPTNRNLVYFPGAVWNERFVTKVLIINPYDRSVPCTVRLFNTAGKYVESKEIVVGGKDYAFEAVDEALLGTDPKHLAPSGVGSLVVFMRYKLLVFVAIENTQTKVMTCMDHTMPFAMYKEPVMIN